MDARALTKALGGRWQGKFGLCRCPAHADRTPSLKVRDDPRKREGVDVHCFAGCDWKDVKAALQHQGLIEDFKNEAPRWPRMAEVKSPDTISPQEIDVATEQRSELPLKIWHAAKPLTPDTIGWQYFTKHRLLDLAPLSDLSHALRWHQGFRMVVALMTDARTNEPRGIHRTFLNDDGTKRERKMLGRQGVVRLSPDEDVTLGLGIAEGIEDALSILWTGWAPVWAATCAGGIASFPVLSGIEHLTIFADADLAGMNAARACAARWIAAGQQAHIALPGGVP